MTTTAKKILIVGPAWVGDMIMAQSLFYLLKQQDKDAIIDVIAPAWSNPILARMPEVRRGITMPIGHGKLQLKERFRLGRSLVAEGYDQAILMPNSFKSALIPFWAKIPQRTGWLGEQRYGLLNDYRKLDKQKYKLVIERFMALALPEHAPLPTPYPYPKLQQSATSTLATQKKYDLTTLERPVLALCTGAEFGPSKQWPAEHYANLANRKLADGWDVWLFGSPKDTASAQRVQEQTLHQCVNLTGQTTLGEAIDLMGLATQVVANDSGLMHMAAALGRPVVALYGSTDPGFAPPLSAQAKSLSLNLDCSPCAKRTCPLGHLKCLRDLTPTLVMGAIDELQSGAALKD